jgi:hypothetical protein
MSKDKRNMINSNQYIFSSLIHFVNEAKDSSIPRDPTIKRYIKTDDYEKEWLKKLDIKDKQLILQNFTTAYVNFKQENYFGVIGWFDAIELNEIIIDFPLNSGIVTALISELQLPIREDSNVDEITNEILFQHEDINYSGHDYNDVVKYFPKIRIYKILEDSPFEGEQLDKISGFYITKNKRNLFLKFSQETLDIFEKIFLEGSDYIPYENLLLSLNSTFWKYSFLDVYRCIEQMFPVAKLDELCKNNNISISLFHLSSQMETILNWKPKEEDSLANIIDKSSPEAKQLFNDVKRFLGRSEEKTEKVVYKIRNSIVHYRPANQQDIELSKLDDINWDKLIRGALLVVMDLYEMYDLE